MPWLPTRICQVPMIGQLRWHNKNPPLRKWIHNRHYLWSTERRLLLLFPTFQIHIKYRIDMIFDFHLMVDRTDDPMDLSQMISALILVFNVCSVCSNFISQWASRNFDKLENRPKGTRTWVSSIFGVTDSDVALKGSWIVRIWRRSWTLLYLYVLWLSELSPEISSIGVIPWLKWSGWLTTLTPPNSTDQVKLSFSWLLSQNCPATNSRISPGQTSS